MQGVSVTAIPGIKYPIPSELGSQTTTGVVSTAVGDHAGIRRVVTFFDFFGPQPFFDLRRWLGFARVYEGMVRVWVHEAGSVATKKKIVSLESPPKFQGQN